MKTKGNKNMTRKNNSKDNNRCTKSKFQKFCQKFLNTWKSTYSEMLKI